MEYIEAAVVVIIALVGGLWHLSYKIGGVSQKFEHVDERFDRIETRLDDGAIRMRDISDRVAHIEGQRN